MMIPKIWIGKKSPTDPSKKEKHKERKIKKEILNTIKNLDWFEQVQEYNKKVT